jgi:hypothetical protein
MGQICSSDGRHMKYSQCFDRLESNQLHDKEDFRRKSSLMYIIRNILKILFSVLWDQQRYSHSSDLIKQNVDLNPACCVEECPYFPCVNTYILIVQVKVKELYKMFNILNKSENFIPSTKIDEEEICKFIMNYCQV